MRPLRFINRITPPFIWSLAKKLAGPRPDDSLQPFVHDCIGSFSQYGEDLVIDAFLGCPADGVYVDVGANDPDELSNTKRFYLRGWRGINVEPNTVLCDRFATERPEDINLNIGIASSSGQMTFHKMDPDTLSTFDANAAKDNLVHPGARVVCQVQVDVEPLAAVLDKHLNGRAVDLLSVDTEGLDLAVLRSNDWTVHRPRIVLVEVAWKGSEIAEYLADQGYTFIWCNGVNGVFSDAAVFGGC